MISVVIALAALAGPLPKSGVLVVAVLVAVVLLARRARARAAAMVAALVLAPILLIVDIWHSPQLGELHRHPLPAAGVVVLGLGAVAALSIVIDRRPWLFAPLVVFALPFRIPIEAGGTTSNLLVPLYLVVAGGAIASVATVVRNPGAAEGQPRSPIQWVERLLAISVVLYAVQALYSTDFEKALQQMVFFYVPFALMFSILMRIRWTTRLLRLCLVIVAGLATVFALVGFAEYATKTIILNPKLVVQNDLHAYFTVNSVFFDPDIFGRFLALVMITLAAALVYDRRPSVQAGIIAVLAVLWAGLVLTLSRSSLGSLLVGLGTVAALRWIVGRTLLVAVAVIAIGAAAVAIFPKTFGLNQGLNGASSGRAGLITGGTHLFEQRPLWGHGSGSFVTEYRSENPGSAATVSASHTIPITIAAEQGVIGEIPYIALVVVAAITLLSGARSDPARGAIAAAFLALVFHSLLYADFLEDPVTWTLLGAGCALAGPWAAKSRRPRPRRTVQEAAVAA